MPLQNRIEIMHGVNLNMLGRRDARHYGSLTLAQLEHQIAGYGRELELETKFFQTNSEERFVEHLQRVSDGADALVLNPGAWTHYSWAIRDALEIAAIPAIEVHLSAVEQREEWRRHSVLEGLVVARVSGAGAEGYREALARLSQELDH